MTTSKTIPAIEINGLSKVYQLYNKPSDRLREALSPIRKKYHRDFFALKDVSIRVNAGECVGIIGMNGSGKSTLLQIIAGVLTPSAGDVQTSGKISALLELGAGFNPEFTGLENVFFQCSIMGFRKEETERMLPEILAFADIGDFVNQPVKTYSSGMYVRLAFAVAISVDPDILIVDEALAVGDAHFQSKCMRKIREFRAKEKTLLFVSHDPGAVKSLCSRAYLLNKGEIVDEGAPAKVFNYYNALLAEKDNDSRVQADKLKELERRRSGNGKVTIEDVALLDDQSRPVETLTSGDYATINMKIRVNESIEDPSIGLLIRDRLGNDIFGTNNFLMGIELGELKPGDVHCVKYRLKMDLGDNLYNITVAIHSGDTHIEDNYDWINEALIFKIVPDPKMKFSGYCRLNPEFDFSSAGQIIQSPS